MAVRPELGRSRPLGLLTSNSQQPSLKRTNTRWTQVLRLAGVSVWAGHPGRAPSQGVP
jgi:hypothetical protein